MAVREMPGQFKAVLVTGARDLINLRSERKLFDFTMAAAARSGKLLNASDIANFIGVDCTPARARHSTGNGAGWSTGWTAGSSLAITAIDSDRESGTKSSLAPENQLGHLSAWWDRHASSKPYDPL